MPSATPTSPFLNLTTHGSCHIITLAKAPENRLNKSLCQSLIAAIHYISTVLVQPGDPGCIITRGSDAKFWCTGLDLDEVEQDPNANADGFFPLLHCILDCPIPTIALLTGHTFGGACPLALAHDYRIMNSERGFFSMPPVDLGLHFPGIGALPKAKLRPEIARKMLLEAHKWTGKAALEDGIVDAVAPPSEMLDIALRYGEKVAQKAKMGVYAALRGELWGEAIEKFQRIAWVHSKPTTTKPRAKI